MIKRKNIQELLSNYKRCDVYNVNSRRRKRKEKKKFKLNVARHFPKLMKDTEV